MPGKTADIVQKAAQRIQDKTSQPVQRQYAYLDSIAVQRQASDVKRREAEIRAAEASMNAQPINVTGQINPLMTSQIAQGIAERREALKAAVALDGDDRVLTYCGDILAQRESPLAGQITINGEPLLRGAYAQPFAPGMQNG